MGPEKGRVPLENVVIIFQNCKFLNLRSKVKKTTNPQTKSIPKTQNPRERKKPQETPPTMLKIYQDFQEVTK